MNLRVRLSRRHFTWLLIGFDDNSIDLIKSVQVETRRNGRTCHVLKTRASTDEKNTNRKTAVTECSNDLEPFGQFLTSKASIFTPKITFFVCNQIFLLVSLKFTDCQVNFDKNSRSCFWIRREREILWISILCVRNPLGGKSER